MLFLCYSDKAFIKQLIIKLSVYNSLATDGKKNFGHQFIVCGIIGDMKQTGRTNQNVNSTIPNHRIYVNLQRIGPFCDLDMRLDNKPNL